MRDEGGRRRPDPATLVAGLLALPVAVLGVTGLSPADVPGLRWVLAAAAVVTGVAILVAGLRNSRGAPDD